MADTRPFSAQEAGDRARTAHEIGKAGGRASDETPKQAKMSKVRIAQPDQMCQSV